MKTIGQIMLEDALPEDLKHYASKTLDKSRTKQMLKELAQKYPDKYADTIYNIGRMAASATTDYGKIASPSLTDLNPPESIQKEKKQMRNHIEKIKQSNIPSEEKTKRISEYAQAKQKELSNRIVEEGAKENNAFALGAKYGYRGKPLEILQLQVGDLVNKDAEGNFIPVVGLHGYGEGLTTAEQLGAAAGGMMGMANVQLMTAKTGYLGKNIAQVAGDVKVTGEDCGAVGVGMVGKSDNPDNFGKVLAMDVDPFKAGTVLDENTASKLNGRKVVLRSPLTCQQRYGICQKCSGETAEGKFPEINDYIGITSANTVSEPMTQALGLESKHTGETSGNLSSFDEVNQMYQMSESFKGAQLAPQDGKIQSIKDAPQGGKYVVVNDKEVYVPPENELKIKQGDQVEAGDPLTEGMVNPKEITQYKGIGEGRRIFSEQQRNTLGKNKINLTPQQSDVISRGFVDHVKITDPEGINDIPPGKIITYSELQDRYVPREGTEKRKPREAVNKYLERPALHYTVGTKVTPRIAKDLGENLGNNITVHSQPPGFEPYMHRAADISTIKEDWKDRLGGFNIEKALLDSAREKSISRRDAPGNVAQLMNPVILRNKLFEQQKQ